AVTHDPRPHGAGAGPAAHPDDRQERHAFPLDERSEDLSLARLTHSPVEDLCLVHAAPPLTLSVVALAMPSRNLAGATPQASVATAPSTGSSRAVASPLVGRRPDDRTRRARRGPRTPTGTAVHQPAQ